MSTETSPELEIVIHDSDAQSQRSCDTIFQA